jgi:glycogen debranching enzyme
MTTLLLKVDGNGDPAQDGVKFLPSLPLPKDYKEGDCLFKLILFLPAACPIARDGIIWINMPPDASTKFQRNKFFKRVIPNTFTSDIEIDLRVYQPGCYSYYASYTGDDGKIKTTRKSYFVVPPSLYIRDSFLPLNSIALESIVSKWLGPRDNWEAVFSEVKRKGYNMVHFTPLQQRGESNSPYSIYDQLQFDSSLFKDEQDVTQFVSQLHTKHGLLSITDVVLNHTANNSDWLREHPEAGYNRITAPHLASAIELDGMLLKFSDNLESLGYPLKLNSIEDLLSIMEGIKTHVISGLKLWEFYVVNVDTTIDEVKKTWSSTSTATTTTTTTDSLKKIEVPDEIKGSPVKLGEFVAEIAGFFTLRGRFDNKVDPQTFASILNSIYESQPFDEIEPHAREILNEINLPLYKEYDNDVEIILEQLFNRIKYLRIDDHGPRLGEISKKSPLTEPYFSRFVGTDGKDYQLANNGWIWNGDPLVDFASENARCYLLREVIIWGDCVKLRYGDRPADSPYLWSRMTDYIEMNAKIFNGFRIDNCHSTPLHVGEHFLDIARSVNPHIYIVAELFTGSEEVDNLFVERLGITSLIREAMQAWSVEELSRLVHRHAGAPIGSFQPLPLDDYAYPADNTNSPVNTSLSEIQIPRILESTKTHALFMDCTHDNETPFDKRTVEDTLPNAALVSLCATAVGSVFGYDECYPHLLDVVNENRTYTFGNGIGDVKAKLYEIRKSISDSTFIAEDHEMHVHHEGQYITLQRVNSKTGEGWFLITRSKFYQDQDQWLAPVVLKGTTAKFEFAYSLERAGDPKRDDQKITGVPVVVRDLEPLQVEHLNGDTRIRLPDEFPQGSIAILKTQFNNVDSDLDDFLRTGAIDSTKGLSLSDLNALLYKCESEERDASAGKDGVYNIPDHGRLVYAGLQGWISVLRDVISNNDLAHPIANHLRTGLWALDYVTDRLDKYTDGDGVDEFRSWLKTRLDRIKEVPFFLVPRYFALVIGVAYEALRLKSLRFLSTEIQNGNLFAQRLALTSLQMVGNMRSTSLSPFRIIPSMAAGLPHFSYDYMRCWGRDVFISARGLLLATGRFEDTKNHILNFAATLKHGLIPNLLDAGRNPRYNARDAAWFFLQCIQDYITIVPNGEDILKDKVKRRFPLDDRYIAFDDPEAFSYETSIDDIIYEILSRHAKGIKYREANAGPRLDSQMKDEGFNVEIHVDWETGLVHGGSQLNCGTWMDKMGESEKAHNKGIPGTPRDGAAIEINGLLKSCLRFVTELNERGLFKYTEVAKNDGSTIPLKEWHDLIQKKFEWAYYVPSDQNDDFNFDVDPSIINRRGIYKDLYKSGKPYEDYQLRPNFAIAMTVAPELFDPKRALGALRLADDVIRGPLGMRTLDPSDLNYRPYYINSDDSDDFATSKGRNYHQGPEWVWCMGYFLRALHHFHLENSEEGVRNRAITDLYQILTVRLKYHRNWIRESPWAGLTELTNKDGDLCHDSSPSQAWSTGCLLDLYFDIWKGVAHT